HGQAVGARVVWYPDDRGGALPPVVMVLGFPARQRPAVLDESAGIEVADAADVRIEGQEAAETQLGRHVQLDELLPVPARQPIEPAMKREEVALGTNRKLDAAEVGQTASQQ